MKVMHTNAGQIARNIAVIIKHNDSKREQLERVRDICLHLTSDDGLSVEVEHYGDGLVRYLISGTRCGMTITAREPQHEIVRKPRGRRAVFVGWVDIHASDVFRILKEV